MANLLIEIGNTALKASWAEGTTLGKHFRYQGENVIDYILSIVSKDKPEVLAVSSVRRITDVEQEALSKECGSLLILDSYHSQILEKYYLPEYLSYDRAASLIAVRNLFKGKPCTVFDFGNTLTVDFMDSEGHYTGGNISLGCRTRFKALNRYSRSLPLVNTPDDFDETGTSVTSSIESGIISGIMFEIEGYVHRCPDNVVIFTGGDSIYFAKKMKNSIFVVCNLALMGLAQITDDYVREKV